jgi:polyphenol oxidase
MIVPSRTAGVAFSEVRDGDMLNDHAARAALSSVLGIRDRWATLRQVHGSEVVRASGPGIQSDADAVWTTEPGLPLAVFTADCMGVVLQGADAVGVAHAGWRGAGARVAAHLVDTMTTAGHPPQRGVIGPGIGPCCFEVGEDVAAMFPGHTATTAWGAGSVDLASAIAAQLDGLAIEVVDGCTRHQDRFFSHRRDRTACRQAAIGWIR